jgi:TPR repeat protein
MARADGWRIATGALVGACAGYLVAGVVASAQAWPEAWTRYAYAWQGGRGESADWGEPVFYGILLLVLPGAWKAAAAVLGAGTGATVAWRWLSAPRVAAAAITLVVAAATGTLLLADFVGGRRQSRQTASPIEPLPPALVEDWQRRCAAGAAKVCFQLAELYRTGGALAKDAARAAELHRKACDLGETPSCFKLAGMYEAGDGVAFDAARTLALYQQVCDADDAAGCYAVGYWSRSGLRGQLADKTKARLAFEKGCRLGSGPSCFLLGQMAEADQDLVRAAGLYRQACAQHYANGCQFLGDFYLHGEGVAMDAAQAQALYRQTAGMYEAACERGDGSTCYALAFMYENGNGVAEDHRRALAFWRQACAAGIREACSREANYR